MMNYINKMSDTNSIKNSKKTIRRMTAFVIAVLLLIVSNLNLITAKAEDLTTGQTASTTASTASTTGTASTASTTGTTSTVSTTGTVSLSGVIVCENCRKASPVNHTRKCTQMKSCEASGYGIVVAQADKTYKFYKFDALGDAKTPTFLAELETAGVVKYLSVVVTGTYTSEKITAPSGGIYDGFNVTDIVFDASHNSFEANAVSINNTTITVAAIENQLYTGTEIKPTVTVLDGEYKLGLSDYTTTYTNNLEAGTSTVTITGIGAYYKGSISKTFRIFKDADILFKAVKEGIAYDTPIGISKLHELKISELETTSAGFEKVSKDLENYIKSITYQVVQSVLFDIEPVDENGDPISLLANEYIVLKIPVPEGYDISKIVVYHVADNGDIEVVADASDITDGKIIINAKSFSPYVVAEASTASALLANTVTTVQTPVESGTSSLTGLNVKPEVISAVEPTILDVVNSADAINVQAAIAPATADNNAVNFYMNLIFIMLVLIGYISFVANKGENRKVKLSEKIYVISDNVRK